MRVGSGYTVLFLTVIVLLRVGSGYTVLVLLRVGSGYTVLVLLRVGSGYTVFVLLRVGSGYTVLVLLGFGFGSGFSSLNGSTPYIRAYFSGGSDPGPVTPNPDPHLCR